MNKENASINVEITSPGQEDLEKKCSLSFELNKNDNDDVTDYLPGTSYFVRLYKGKDVGLVTAFYTNGTISLVATDQVSIIGIDEDVYLTFSGELLQDLAFPYAGNFVYEIVGKAYDKNGNVIFPIFTPPSSIRETAIAASVECYAVLKISYKAYYDKYIFVGEEGTGLLVATSICGETSVAIELEEESSSVCSCSTSLLYTDITLIYVDVVTGEMISGAKITIDGKYKGTTDAQGKILIQQITVNQEHAVKATKEGYLNTDSDSLSNDKFIIQV